MCDWTLAAPCPALTAICGLLLGLAVFGAATVERGTALRAAREQEASQALLTSMLDQETGTRGYFQTSQVLFLAPWYQGRADFTAGLAHLRPLVAGDPPLRDVLGQQAAVAAQWRAGAAREIAVQRRRGVRPDMAQALAQKALMDDFRRLNGLFDAQLAMRRNSALTISSWLAASVAVSLAVLLATGAMATVRSLARAEQRRMRRQQELRELLQVAASEEESQLLLIRHVERTVPGAAAAVFNRNNSDDRLEPRLGEAAATGALGGLGETPLSPGSCMAVRLSRSHHARPGDDLLLRCEACGKLSSEVLCEPLLVGGQVIGSVLVTCDRPIRVEEVSEVRASVVQAAPILANQRNLAVAERRAASDSLTGLPNRRAADETLKRMVAQASRAVSPLSAILFDLDHFKRVNDVHGHEQGDRALSSVAQVLMPLLRGSDFAARYGGEEFLVLLPDTDRAGALQVAEKLRGAIASAEVAGMGAISASFGVATLPGDAGEADGLLRQADRALYAAKALGRNRVEVASRIGAGLEAAGGDGPAATD